MCAGGMKDPEHKARRTARPRAIVPPGEHRARGGDRGVPGAGNAVEQRVADPRRFEHRPLAMAM
jgi:hypothetical protein